MKIMKYIFITLFLFMTFGVFADGITPQEAKKVAKNLYFEKTGIDYNNIVFEDMQISESKGLADYYIFDVKGDNGFIIVSAEDSYYPIIGYSTRGVFGYENQPENVKYWMNTYTEQINYLRKNKIETSSDVKRLWEKYNVDFKYFKPQKSGKAVEPLVGDILWNQDGGWNEYCPEDAAGPDGHVYAGCVATAMGIILKYHQYPIHGIGSHSYYSSYGLLSVDYANTVYFWNLMDNHDANQYSAMLLYHVGVSVNMSYSVDGSGAFSVNVPSALDDYFGYSSAIYKDRDDYTSTSWKNLLKTEIDASRPIYYSGRDDDNGGHAFVCSGYDNSDLFHYNFGWSGSNNGYYSITDVGGFHNGQAAVVNIYPSTSTDYPNPPQNVLAEVDLENTNTFTANLSWDAPATKAVTGYTIYRDFTEIATVGATQFEYVDNTATPGSYDYSVRAIYSDGESLVAHDNLDGEYDITFNFVNSSGSAVSMVTATLSNDGTYSDNQYSSFLSFLKFSNVLWGGNFSLEASHSSYPTVTEAIDFNNSDRIYTFVMGEGIASVNKLEDNVLNIFPNPSEGIINVMIDEVSNSSIMVTDISGKIIYNSNNLKRGLNTFVFSNQPKGFYILKYKTQSGEISKTFIII